MRTCFNLLLSVAVGLAIASEQWGAEAALTLSDSSGTLPLPVSQGRNSVSGHVFGDSRHPLSDVHVELLSDLGVTISRTRTNGRTREHVGSTQAGGAKQRRSGSGRAYLREHWPRIKEELLAGGYAVFKARGYVREGGCWVVDIDLEKFFGRVNHVLMSRLARRIKDTSNGTTTGRRSGNCEGDGDLLG